MTLQMALIGKEKLTRYRRGRTFWGEGVTVHELKVYDEGMRVWGAGRGWEVVGKEVETEAWPDARASCATVRSLD